MTLNPDTLAAAEKAVADWPLLTTEQADALHTLITSSSAVDAA